MNVELWLRLALACFPQDFRRRRGDEMLDTVEDMLRQSVAADRAKLRRRIFFQLARAGLAERLSVPPFRVPSFRASNTHFHKHSRSPFMDDLIHDLKSAFHSLARRPAFAMMVIATLAVGLGTSAAMFGVVHGVLLEPLPFDEPDRLVTVLRNFTNDPGREEDNMSLPDLLDLQERTTSLEAVAGYGRARKTLVKDGEPQLMVTGRVTNGLLNVFGLAPHLGRDLESGDALLDAPKAVVLSHAFWLKQFGGDPSAIGTVLQLSGDSHTVVGIAPAGFDYPSDVEAWVPWQIDTEGCGRGCHLLDTVARLAPGVDPESCSRELEVLGAALAEKFPESNIYKRFAVRQLQQQEVAPVQSALWLLMGAVLLVVLVAAANVANLVLVRGARRRREMAIRRAVGAGRARLFRQLMLENGLLALGGALAGLVIGQGVLTAFLHLAPPDLPRLDSVGLDVNVLAFTVALSAVVLLIFGLAPALRIANVELRSRGGAGTRRGRRSRRVLLTAELALTLVLLLGAGLLLRSFVSMTDVDLGFAPERVTRFSFLLPDSGYSEPGSSIVFSSQLEQRLRDTPGVEAAGLAFTGPFGSSQISSTIQPLDRPEPAHGEELGAVFDVVTPGFFETLQIPIMQGRVFADSDTREAPLALVISQALAERYYPGKNPVGERAKVGVSFGFDDDDAAYTIIGVVPDVRAYSVTQDPEPAVYMAQAQTASPYLSGFVRSRSGVDMAPAIREHMRALDPLIPLRSIETQEAAIHEAYGPQRFYLALLGAFAAIALILSAVGLYGVIAYLVSQRTRELAVRMALGADSGSILRLVLVDALQPTLLGVFFGLTGAWLGATVLDKLLFGITAHDLATYLAAPSILIVCALLATLAPALRASRLQPRVALQEE